MRRYSNVIASLCGGALVGEMLAPGGCVLGGLLGIWIGWPKSDVRTS